MKKILLLLLLSFSLFFTSKVDAAEILQSNGSGFSSPTVTDNKARINLTGGNVKYIRHTKYEQSSWSNPVAYKQLRASSTFTGFAYSCPGYYMTRMYSDSAGTKLIGWVRVYVANDDINNSSCNQILDETKKVPPTTKKINVTHPSDVVDEPSKMINGSTNVSASAPVTRDTTDEDLVEFAAGQVPEGTLTAEQACNAKAASTGVGWQLKYNSNTSSFECVVASDCLVNSGLWHCNAQTVAQKYPSSTTTIDNPDREAYEEDSCSDATASNCLDMYTMSNYSRPTNTVTNEYTSDGGTTTDPDEPGETEPTDPENPNRDPAMEAKCSVDKDFNSEECIKYRFCLDSPEHPTCQEDTAPTESVCFQNGEPNFSDPDCYFNCDDPFMQAYTECAPDTSHFQDIRYCWDENGDFKFDSPYCDFLSCDSGATVGENSGIVIDFELWEECGGPIACDDIDGSAQRITEIRGVSMEDITIQCYYEIYKEDVCITAWGNFMFSNPSCNPCDSPEFAADLGMACPDYAPYESTKGGKITEIPDLLNPENPGEEITPDNPCEICKIFECPGWEEYLGFITDTVAMAIGDITTPEVEPLPDLEVPSTPATPNVDKKQLAPPTGKEDPALGDASFDSNDLKSGEEIQFRDDPGGFDIVDPLQQLEGTAKEAPQPALGSVTQPQPTGGNASSGTAQQPQYNGGTATAPTTGGTAKQPDYGGSAQIPTYNAPPASSVPKQTDERKVEVIAP